MPKITKKTANHSSLDSVKKFGKKFGKYSTLAAAGAASSMSTAFATAVTQGGAKNTYAATDEITLSAATASTVLGAADALTSMINTNGTSAVYSLSGAFKLDFTGATFSLKATDGESLTVNMATSGGSLDLGEATLGTVIVNTAAGAFIDVTGADTHTFAMDGSAANTGKLEVSNNTTFSSTIGSTNGISVINVDNTKVGTFNAAVKASTITLTGDAVFAAAVTATDIKLVAGKATFNNSTAVTIAGAISETSGATEVFVTDTADNAGALTTFSGAVAVDTITIGATAKAGIAKFNSTVAGAATIHGGNVGVEDSRMEVTTDFSGAIVLTQAGAGDAEFKTSGATAVSISGGITATSDGDGQVTAANTGGTTFTTIGTDAAKNLLTTVAATGQATFGGAVASNTLNILGEATIQVANNESEAIALGAASTLFIDKTVLNGVNVFNEVVTTRPTMTAGSKIYMPENLKNDQTLVLFLGEANTGIGDHADTITEANAAIQDNAIMDFSAAALATGNGSTIVTASTKSIATTASELKTTVNDATAAQQVMLAAISDTNVDGTLEDAFNNALNGIGGETATSDTDLIRQVAPQNDVIAGSSVATRAMTGTVQGIVSNRMASLRSGDAYISGMSAGNGMSAQSGFIQAFGSEVEQKNTKKNGATIAGFDSETSGLAIGIDGITDSGSTIGLSASYSSTDLDGKGTGKSKNNIDSYTVSAYADKSTENGYIEGSITYGINENQSSRIVNEAGLNRSYAATYDSEQLSLKFGGGMPNEVADSTFVTPYGSVTSTLITTDVYNESSTTAADNLRLKVAQSDVNSLIGTVGVKAHMVTPMGTPMISLAINNEFGDNKIKSTNTYKGGGTAFVTSTDVEEVSATLGLGYSFGNDMTSLNIAYEAEVNEDDYLGQYGSVKLVAKF